MAGFGGVIGGIGRAINSFDAQQSAQLQRQKDLQALSMAKMQADQAQRDQASRRAAAAGLVNLYGGGPGAIPGALPGSQPMPPAPQAQGPQPPMPGQASQPAAAPFAGPRVQPPAGGTGVPPTAAPGGSPQPLPNGGPSGAGAPSPQQQGGGGLKLPPPDPNDIGDPRTFVRAYKQANPNATPDEVLEALNESAAIMNPQKKFELDATKIQLQSMQKMMDLQEKYYATDKKAGTSITIQNMKEGAADKKAAAGAIDDDTKRFLAERLLAGDTTAVQGLGYGSAGARNRADVMKTVRELADARGMNGEAVATKIAEMGGLKAGERALGTRTATMGMAVDEAKRIAPLALQASAAIDRTRFPTINAMEQAVRKGTGDPNIARFLTAHNSLINVYARAISPTGVPTVSDKDHAREILDTAYSEGQYQASVDQMMQEMAAAQKAPGDVKRELRGEAPEDQGGGTSQGPTATDANGNKVQWDGSTWKPVK